MNPTRSARGLYQPLSYPLRRWPVLAGVSLAEMEKALIIRTLEEAKGNRTRTADILGINRRTLQNKLKEYQINPSIAGPSG